MPQVGSHLIIADAIRHELNDSSHIDNNHAEYSLGAIGPDLALFLFDPVGDSGALNRAIRVYLVIHDVKNIFSEVADKVTGPAQDFADWVTGGLTTSLTSLTGRSFEALKACIAGAVVPGGSVTIRNPFAGLDAPGVPNDQFITVQSNDLSILLREFGHPYANDPPYREPEPAGRYDNWWWVDLLHYRRTGTFAKALVNNAGNNDSLTAYANGYWTHIAADVCGHPYVNGVVGGPFRNHAIRHMVLENIIDTWCWEHFNHADICNSRLHRSVAVDDFQSIAQLLRETMREVFTSPPRNGVPIRPTLFNNADNNEGIPSVAQLVLAYEKMLYYLELSTDVGLVPPEAPPGSPVEFFQEIGDSIASTAGSISEQFSSDNEWWEWLLAPFLAALYALALLFKLITLPAAILVRVATLYPRWLAYQLELALYGFVLDARWALALTGWGRPSSADLHRAFARTAYHMPPERTGLGAFNYPYGPIDHDQFAFWLLDPALNGAAVEDPKAECSPYRKLQTPDVFITGPTYDVRQDRLLKGFVESVRTAADTVEIERETFRGPQLGNAVDFGVKLIEGDYPQGSFDLDGDKGYGYLGWESPISMPSYRKDLWV